MTEHFDAIAAEVTRGLGDRLWRVREACCHAASALIQVSNFNMFWLVGRLESNTLCHSSLNFEP